MGHARFRFHGILTGLLPAHQRGLWLDYRFRGAPSLKHAIETFGIPHPEIGAPADLSRPLLDGEALDVYPRAFLQPPAGEWRFLLDCHLGRLAKYLRILGFDTSYQKHAPDPWLAETARAEHRLLLTMDRGLLMRSLVVDGALIRAATPRAQLLEAVERFHLAPHFHPLRRCLHCNTLLSPIPKALVLDRIPPKTRLWCDQYLECPACAHLYWPGSHHENMLLWVAGLRQSSKQPLSPQASKNC